MSIENLKNNELCGEQLEKVSGGYGTQDSHLDGFSGFVDMYAVEGYMDKGLNKEPLYFVKPEIEVIDGSTFKTGRNEWIYGRVYNSYERDLGCENSIRTHDIYVIDGSIGYQKWIGGTHEITGDDWCAYKYKTN